MSSFLGFSIRCADTSSYDDHQGRTRYVIEFVLGPFSELEVLARGKAKAEGSGTEADLPMETAA